MKSITNQTGALKLSYPAGINIFNRATAVLRRTIQPDTAPLAQAIIETGEFMLELEDIADSARRNSVNGFSFVKPDIKPDCEAVNKEFLKVTSDLLPRLKEKTLIYSKKLWKKIKDNAHNAIDELSINNLNGKPLLTALLLTISKLPQNTKAFAVFKNAAALIREKAGRAVHAKNAEDSKNWGVTYGLFMQASVNARGYLAEEKNRNKENVSAGIDAISYLLSILTKKSIPLHLLKGAAADIYNKDINRRQNNITADDTPLNEFYDRDNPAYIKFKDGFDMGIATLKRYI